LVRVDLHLHSSASFDCSVSPEKVAARCRQVGLGPVFLTDHNTIKGALQLQGGVAGRVVAGEEVMTGEGEIIGLFLTKDVESGLTALETAKRIKEQGGLVYIEHPYDLHRRHLSEEAIEKIADLVDVVEVFNSRSDARANQRARDLCDTLGVAAGAGSDSHTLGSIGSAYVEMEDFTDAGDFLDKLRRGKIVTGKNRFVLMAQARLRGRMAR
jgi:predicted metal-dependent phosphoesterase TrpH